MADLQPITEFIFNNRSLLSLNVLRLTWPQEWGLKLFDMEVRISIDGIMANGRGQFSDEETAFEIAASEALERFMVQSLNLRHSYGVACHSNKEKALTNSVRELIEREVFFRFFYDTKTYSLVDIKSELTSSHDDYTNCQTLLRQLTNLGLNIEFWDIGNTPFGSVIMCIAQGEYNDSILSGGASIGLALSENQNASLLKSLIEVSCKLAFIKQFNQTRVSENEVFKTQHNSSSLRQKLLLDRNYLEAFKKSILKVDSSSSNANASELENVRSVTLSTESLNIVTKAPIYIYQSFFQSESAYLGTGSILDIAEKIKPHFLG